MIAKQIYEGKTAEELGIPEIQYESRKEVLNRFLSGWNGKDFEGEFSHFLKKEQSLVKNTYGPTGKPVPHKKIEKPQDLSYGEMFTDLVDNIKTIAKSGVALVNVKEHTRRYSICRDCEYLTVARRCMKCGCFMKLKSKFKSMDCPDGKWGQE